VESRRDTVAIRWDRNAEAGREVNKGDHLPRQHPHADAFLGAQQTNASLVWRDDGRIGEWLFKACMCGNDTPVVRRRVPGLDNTWQGVRVCKSCGLKFEIQLGGGACGAVMTEPYGLWLHRQRYRWALWRWLRAEPGRQITCNVSAKRHRDAITPALDDLSLPSWPVYCWLRLMEWAQEPRQSLRRLVSHARQFLAPMNVLGVLKKHVLRNGALAADRWTAIVRDQTDGAIRTVRVHLISGRWDLQIEEPARADDCAPWPPVSYRAGDDMLELVGRLVGLKDRRQAREWLQDHGYVAPERIGLQRVHEAPSAAASGSA